MLIDEIIKEFTPFTTPHQFKLEILTPHNKHVNFLILKIDF